MSEGAAVEAWALFHFNVEMRPDNQKRCVLTSRTVFFREKIKRLLPSPMPVFMEISIHDEAKGKMAAIAGEC